MVPGGGAVGSVLETAGSVAGAVAGAVEASGPVIVLEYKAGPPAKLSYLRRASERSTRAAASDARVPDKFDLDGINVFAISPNGMFGMQPNIGAGPGLTITLFEGYKPNVFFTPSFFLSGKVFLGGDLQFLPALNVGVLFKHRFPKDRVLWNLGASLEFMWADPIQDVEFDYTYWDGSDTRTDRGEDSYVGGGFLFGMGIQTGFSFRLSRIFSIDLNGFAKFPFGTLDMDPGSYYYQGQQYISRTPEKISIWPFTAGVELALTFWIPYRSKR
jgi:hypothetical protein